MKRQVYPPRDKVYPSTLFKELDIGLACCITQTQVGGYIGLGFQDGSVAILDADSLGVVYRLRACSMAILALSFSANGELFAAVSADMTACLFDLSKPGIKTKITFDVVPQGASFAPYDVSKFCYYNESFVFETDFAGNTVQLNMLPGDKSKYESVLCLPNDTVVLGTSNGFLRFFQPKENGVKEHARDLKVGQSSVLKIEYFPNVHFLAALCDKSIKICSYELNNLSAASSELAVSNCEIVKTVYSRHVAFDWSCTAFSSDGENVFVASKGLHGRLLLYNADVGVEILELEDHKGIITSLLYDEDRSMLLGVSSLGNVYMWTPPTSETEWSYQIPEFRYDDTMDIRESSIDDWYVKLPTVLDPPADPDFFANKNEAKEFVIPYHF